jgi:PPOX class probable F420-dependent enzyme
MPMSILLLGVAMAVRRTTLEELPGWAGALLREAPVGRLGLLDGDGAPRVLAVTYAVHEGALWSAIDHKRKRDPGREPARVRWLRRDPRAALTADRYDEDWSRLAWVQVLGEVSLRESAGEPAAMAALVAKYAAYAADPPPGPLLRLEPQRVLCWSAVPDVRR